jgi:hypothetical protein
VLTWVLAYLDRRFLTVHRPQHRDQIVEQRGERLLERERFVTRALWRDTEVVQHGRKFELIFDVGIDLLLLLVVGSVKKKSTVYNNNE